MKKLLIVSIALAVLALHTAPTAMAAENKGQDGKEVTLSGEAMCGKCALKTSDKCVNVVRVKQDGKDVDYVLVDNKVSKDFHSKVCKENQKVTLTGMPKKAEGKTEFIASKIEVAK